MTARFKYLLDPLFLYSLALYCLNKSSFLGSRLCNFDFCNCYLNDVLLVPVLVPILLFSAKILGFRKQHSPPMLLEVVCPLAIWSITFELIGPVCFGKGTSDPADILAYSLGGLTSWVIWNRNHLMSLRVKEGRSPAGRMPLGKHT